MEMCQKCCKICGVLVLLAGLGFLLRDLNMWMFWGLNWWTVAFLLMGVGKVARSNCPHCMGKKKR